MLSFTIHSPAHPDKYYEISSMRNGNIWIIQHPSGEAGEFESGLFWKTIEQFYNDNF